MEKNHLKINLEDIPDDMSQLSDDTEIVVNDHDDLQDDSFWEDGESTDK